jgi:hypothetical protein
VTIQDPEGSAVRRFFGVVLITVGILMIALAGLCSAGCLALMLAFMGKAPSLGEFMSGLGIVAVFGAPPIIVGYVLYRVGRGLRRGSKAPG